MRILCPSGRLLNPIPFGGSSLHPPFQSIIASRTPTAASVTVGYSEPVAPSMHNSCSNDVSRHTAGFTHQPVLVGPSVHQSLYNPTGRDARCRNSSNPQARPPAHVLRMSIGRAIRHPAPLSFLTLRLHILCGPTSKYLPGRRITQRGGSSLKTGWK